MSLRFSASHMVAGVFIAVATVGCSSGSPQPQVAALPTSTASSGSPGASTASSGSPGASASASATTSSRPRERLDASPSQLEALYAPWNHCMDLHGGGKRDKPTPAAETAAAAACLQVDPLPPWQYDPANPKAMGFVQRVVACLHQHGVRYAQVLNTPGEGRIDIALGGPQNDSASIGAGLDLIPTCDQQVLRENASSTSP
jgi:hypothetical protein